MGDTASARSCGSNVVPTLNRVLNVDFCGDIREILCIMQQFVGVIRAGVLEEKKKEEIALFVLSKPTRRSGLGWRARRVRSFGWVSNIRTPGPHTMNGYVTKM